MITHVVMFKLATGNEDQAEVMRARLMALPEKIPQIKHYEVGLNTIQSELNYDLVLISKFEDMQALQDYKDHPEHQAVLSFIRSIISSSVAVDYEADM